MTTRVPKTGDLLSQRLKGRETTLSHNLPYFQPNFLLVHLVLPFVSREVDFENSPILALRRGDFLRLTAGETWEGARDNLGSRAHRPGQGGEVVLLETLCRGLLCQG